MTNVLIKKSNDQWHKQLVESHPNKMCHGLVVSQEITTSMHKNLSSSRDGPFGSKYSITK